MRTLSPVDHTATSVQNSHFFLHLNTTTLIGSILLMCILICMEPKWRKQKHTHTHRHTHDILLMWMLRHCKIRWKKNSFGERVRWRLQVPVCILSKTIKFCVVDFFVYMCKWSDARNCGEKNWKTFSCKWTPPVVIHSTLFMVIELFAIFISNEIKSFAMNLHCLSSILIET